MRGLAIGGCNLAGLAENYGTPFYVFGTATLGRSSENYAEALRANLPSAKLASPMPAKRY